MSATSQEAFDRIDALVDSNTDDRLPDEIRDEIKAAVTTDDEVVLEELAEAGGDDQ